MKGRVKPFSRFGFAALVTAAITPNAVLGQASDRVPDYVYVVGIDTSGGPIRLGSRVRLLLKGLTRAAADNNFKLDSRKLVLYLGGRPLPGVTARPVGLSAGVPPGTDNHWLEFELSRTEANKDAWQALLGSPQNSIRWVLISTGLPNGGAIAWTGAPERFVQLRAFNLFQLFGAIGVPALVAVLLARLIAKRQLIHEPATSPRARADSTPAYSLARFQAALWFVVIFCSFIFIALITLDFNSILNAQALVLMGISASTGTFSGAIQQQKANAAAHALARLAANAPDTARLAGTPVGQEAVDAFKAEAKRLEGKMGKPHHRGFWADLLNDKDGPTVYRVQLLLWTVLLALIFLWEVYRRLTMPEFSTTLLTLMGISGGTYLGFKVPEQQ